jgi:hypothetical protein
VTSRKGKSAGGANFGKATRESSGCQAWWHPGIWATLISPDTPRSWALRLGQVGFAHRYSLWTRRTCARSEMTGRQVRCTTFILALSLLCSSCGWRTKYVFTNDQTKASVELANPFPLDSSGVRIILRRGSQVTTLMEERADVFLNFADVAWLDGGNVVAVKACTSGPLVELAYDLRGRSPVSFDRYRSALARHIVDKYGLSSKMAVSEVYGWACADGPSVMKP